jgi:hypothetical protein
LSQKRLLGLLKPGIIDRKCRTGLSVKNQSKDDRMKNFKSMCALIFVASSLHGMKREAFDATDRIRTDILRLVNECRAEIQVPATVNLKLELRTQLPDACAIAGLEMDKPENFSDPRYASLVSHETKTYLAFMLFSMDFTKYPHGAQKGHILKMLFNIRQVSLEHMTSALDAARYPKGVRQEAAAKALSHLKCIECMREYVGTLPEESDQWLTQAEALELVGLAATQAGLIPLCEHHKKP